MKKKGGPLINWGLIFFLSFLLGFIGCANRTPKPCFKDGREYCLTDEWIFSESWYSCYLRGISCAQGGCWENARDEFLRSVYKRDADERWVRTYGMHRLPEYFPNRELGIAYYHLSDLDQALNYLTLSLKHCESAKAKYYLNKVRKEKLLLTQEDRIPPQLFLDAYPKAIAAPQFFLTGQAKDDTFVADIIIQVNNEQPIFLMEVSRPRFYAFRQQLVLRSGINDIAVKVVDLLGNQEEHKVKIMVDQEGPMIWFAEAEGGDQSSPISIQGVLYDPSGVAQFYLNGKKIKLIKLDLEEGRGTDNDLSHSAYSFLYQLSPQEQLEGLLDYRAKDALDNVTTGSVSVLPKTQETEEQQASNIHYAPVKIAMAPQAAANDMPLNLPLYQTAKRRALDPVTIQIEPIPQETFQNEICLKINILARRQIHEISINEQPILSIYGLHWLTLFNRIKKKFLDKNEEGRFLFQRVIKLKEGENSLHLQVVDMTGERWEKIILIRKKTKKIHELDERWRTAIPFISYSRSGEDDEEKKENITYQLIEAFVEQGRFKVIDLENLPFIIDEKNLCQYLGRPLLGHSSDLKLWIDTFLLGYIQEAEDSLTLSASLVDLETGEILATKDVCEEIDSSQLAWQEGLREHAFHICSILAAKFKAHFPLCEGNIISLTSEELKTGICRNDGLKEGMKLLLYNRGAKKDEDYVLLGEAKVEHVKEEYSLAKPLHYLIETNIDVNEANTKWGVITR
ncbi:MAG: hypothetical protein JXA79_07910 [Deltaproteobacteria bacterium]|nr:hypothetical protein [Deltaproteobacteria bacterium]